jgi:hypothetical protein
MGLGERYNSFSNRALTSARVIRRKIVCPFWTDLIGNTDTSTKDGKVFYRSYTK